LDIALVYDIARWEERAILEAARKRSISVELLHLETQPLTVNGKPPR